MAKGKWTRDQILHMLHTKDRAVGRALLTLLEEQTFDERRAEDTRYANNRGFTPQDAKIMTNMAKQFKQRNFLSRRQLDFLRAKKEGSRYPSRIGKYARQIAKKVNQRIDELTAQIEELESRSQNTYVKEMAELRRAELARISPKELESDTVK